jgi:hypothetical protein
MVSTNRRQSKDQNDVWLCHKNNALDHDMTPQVSHERDVVLNAKQQDNHHVGSMTELKEFKEDMRITPSDYLAKPTLAQHQDKTLDTQ